jgi:hypothetical protein
MKRLLFLLLLVTSAEPQKAVFMGQNFGTASFLLDVTQAAFFAGSASHSLRAAYGGPLVQIERASDSTTSDVSQNPDGTINQTTINSFCSGTTCNVSILYDQSGNGHNAVQATFSLMPIIYTSGAVVTNGVNNRPSMQWDNTNRYLLVTVATSGSTWEALAVASLQSSSAVAYAGIFAVGDSTGDNCDQTGYVCFFVRDNTNPGLTTIEVSSGNPSLTFSTYATQFLADSYVTLSGGTLNLAINGSAPQTGASGGSTLSGATLDIGTVKVSSSLYWFGNISDIVLYQANLTSGQRTAAHTIESGFFGTP